jgi:hypothetical protein
MFAGARMKFARLDNANAALADFARSHSLARSFSLARAFLGYRKRGDTKHPGRASSLSQASRSRLVAEPDIPAAPRG